MPGPDGKIMHAELDIGDSVIMLSDAMEGNPSPKSLSGSPVTVMTYVEDVDAVFKSALGKGAKEVRPVENQFYGDRAGAFEDPFGHQWFVATHVEDVSPEELEKRSAQAAQSG